MIKVRSVRRIEIEYEPETHRCKSLEVVTELAIDKGARGDVESLPGHRP